MCSAVLATAAKQGGRDGESKRGGGGEVAFLRLIYSSQYSMKMDYIEEVSIVYQATDGADIRAILKAGIVDVIIRYGHNLFSQQNQPFRFPGFLHIK